MEPRRAPRIGGNIKDGKKLFFAPSEKTQYPWVKYPEFVEFFVENIFAVFATWVSI